MSQGGKDTPAEETTAPERPLLQVVNPDATPEEIAALVAVFSAMGSGEAPPRKPVRVWGAPHRQVRQTLHSGRGAWRGSGLPH